MNWLDKAQNYLRETNHDAWIVYDFQLCNPIAHFLLGFKPSATRRYFLIIDREGAPTVVASVIDKNQFADKAFPVVLYRSYEELCGALKRHIAGYKTVYMDYSRNGDIPHMSKIDYGALQLVTSLNDAMAFDSSADIFQYAMATWSPDSFGKHIAASKLVADIKTRAFGLIFSSLEKNAAISEYEVQQFIVEKFRESNLITRDLPCVAVNANSSNSHYSPAKGASQIIKPGDWILIDLWAKLPDADAVYSDITWVGYAGPSRDVPPRCNEVFAVVKDARDTAVSYLKENLRSGLEGWQVDKVTRDVIAKAGYGDYFHHRTGHSMAPGEMLHALSVNLDNFEMKDTRKIIPGVGFSIEPGIYLEDFGVRLEINAYVDEKQEVSVTSCVQDAILTLDNRE